MCYLRAVILNWVAMPKIDTASVARAYTYMSLYEDTCLSEAQRSYIRAITGSDDALEALRIAQGMFGHKAAFRQWYSQEPTQIIRNFFKRLTATWHNF